jgi:predicted ATPase
LPNFLLVLGHRTDTRNKRKKERGEEATEIGVDKVQELMANMTSNGKAICTDIVLGPLGLEEVLQMLKDSLPHATTPYEPLALLLVSNTAGNPFFLRQSMYSLAKAKAFQRRSGTQAHETGGRTDGKEAERDRNHLLSWPRYRSHSESSLQSEGGGSGGTFYVWSWDLEAIERQFPLPTDNVISLLVESINGLPEITKRVLCTASVFGCKFDSLLLSKLPASVASIPTTVGPSSPSSSGYSPFSSRMLDIQRHLGVALQDRLIVPSCSGSMTRTTPQQRPLPEDVCRLESTPQHYAFVHDRVHQALYAQIGEVQAKELHLAVGRLLLKENENDPTSVNLFDAVSHINKGASCLFPSSQEALPVDRNLEERLRLAHVNLLVSRKAKDSMAYQAAFDYASAGLYLLRFLPSLPTNRHLGYDGDSSSPPSSSAQTTSLTSLLDLGKEWPVNAESRRLCLNLHLAYGTTGYPSGNVAASRRCLTGLLEHRLTDPLERADASLQLIALETLQGDLQRATEVALASLKELGVRLPTVCTASYCNPEEDEALTEWVRVETHNLLCSFQNRTVQSLLEEPEVVDPNIRMAMAILDAIFFFPVFAVLPILAQVVVILSVKVRWFRKDLSFPLFNSSPLQLSMKFGNATESAVAYATYGYLLIQHGHFALAKEFGLLGVNLARKRNDGSQFSKAAVIYLGTIAPWTTPLVQCHLLGEEVLHTALECGDLLQISYALNRKLTLLSAHGNTPFPSLLVEGSKKFLKLVNTNSLSSDYLLVQLMFLTNLCGLTEDIWTFLYSPAPHHRHPLTSSGAQPESERSIVGYLERKKSNAALASYYTLKLFAWYLYDADVEETLQLSVQAQRYLPFTASLQIQAIHHLYRSLTLLRACREIALDGNSEEQKTAEVDERRRRLRDDYLVEVKENQSRLKIWVKSCRANFYHKWLLVEAELKFTLGECWDALSLYEESIANAQANGFAFESAVAMELAGRFLLVSGKKKLGLFYLKDAVKTYHSLGAKWKMAQLCQRHVEMIKTLSTAEPTDSPSATTGNRLGIGTASSGGGNAVESRGSDTGRLLDLRSVIKLSRVISQEIEFACLLSRVMTVLLENAGAEEGVLILNNNGADSIYPYQNAMPSNSRDAALSTTSQQQPPYFVEAEASVQEVVVQRKRIEDCERVCMAMVHYARITGETVVLDDALLEGLFKSDPYVTSKSLKSAVVLPLCCRDKSIGYVYMEVLISTLSLLPTSSTLPPYPRLAHPAYSVGLEQHDRLRLHS